MDTRIASLSTHPSPLPAEYPERALLPDDPAELARFLYRPIVFREPDRVVHPPSWLEHLPFAFWLAEAVRPAVFVELGTQSGNSYAGFAQAIQMLGLTTAAYGVDTVRGDPQAVLDDERARAEWASYHDRHFSVFSRLIQSTFEAAVQYFADGSIDLLHVDGFHTCEATSADLEPWRPKLSRRGVILLHDINVREANFGARRLWEELKAQSPSFEFLHGNGLGIVAAGPELSEPLRWLFSRSSICPTDVSAVRQLFAQVGGLVSARFAATAIESRLRAEFNERAGQLTALAAATGESLRSEQEAAISRLSSDLNLLNGRLAANRVARETQAAEAALRIARLEEQLTIQRSEHEKALGHRTRLAAELQERVRAESERRKCIEGDRDRLASSSSSRRLPALQDRINITKTRWRRRVRRILNLLQSPAALGVASLTHPARLRDAFVIVDSGLFDEAYYRRRYPDVAASRLTPLAHFVLEGAYEGRDPHPLFDTAHYLRRYPDVAAAGVNPLSHYRARGAFEGRSPHPLFDVAYYLDKNPDVRHAGVEPLRHFLVFGADDGRDPNPFFDCAYYLHVYPDVARSRTNPLVHFVCDGWSERRRPSPAFDTAYYLSQNADVRLKGGNPLAHFIEFGRGEGRRAVSDPGEGLLPADEALVEPPPVNLNVRSLGPARTERPTVLCLSHVMPWPPRAGNEYRIYRMLRWLQDQGYVIIPVIAPQPSERVEAEAVRALADRFSNAVLCGRDGRLEYILRDVPDVLASLGGELTRPVAALLDEGAVRGYQRQLLQMDRGVCHDALITVVLRLQQALGPHVLLAEYIWMSRILPLVSADALKVVDTIDVFSTKKEKVLQFGIDDLHVEPHEEANRLLYADLILAIQDEERQLLQQLVPGKRVVTAGVDFDVVEEPGVPSGRRVLYVASDNPMNRKGLSDFFRFAWPYIRREVPDAELLVAGRVGNALDSDVAGVNWLGPVDDLTPFYCQARVVINPAVAGTGLKIKTLEALGHLRPIVTWPNGTDGLAPELAAICVTVKDWHDFSRRVTGLLATETPHLFSHVQREIIVRLHSPSTVYKEMTEAIATLRENRLDSELARASARV